MSEQTPGWYGDPRGAAGTWRWWDGGRWTGWLSPDASAPPPAEPAAGPGTEPGTEPETTSSTATGGRVALSVAVLAVVAAVLVGVVVVGLVVWVSEPRLPTGPAVAPPPPQARVAEVTYSGSSRAAEIDEARMVMPGSPYVCAPAPEAKPPAFLSLLSCTMIVHENYNAAGDDAGALVGLGVPEPSMIVAGDLPASARRVFDRLHTAFFYDQETTVGKVTTQKVDLGGAREAYSVYGNIGYDYEGLSSTYDRLFVLVALLDSGDYAVLYSDRPDDLPEATLDVLNQSLNSLTTRK